MQKILIINGPKLNVIVQREPEVYGFESFESYLKKLESEFEEVEINYFQSNIEGEIVTEIQKAAANGFLGLIINPGAFTHTSVAIADAINSAGLSIVEVHISNVYKREFFRQHSLISKYCSGTISGFGLEGYRLALQSFS